MKEVILKMKIYQKVYINENRERNIKRREKRKGKRHANNVVKKIFPIKRTRKSNKQKLTSRKT